MDHACSPPKMASQLKRQAGVEEKWKFSIINLDMAGYGLYNEAGCRDNPGQPRKKKKCLANGEESGKKACRTIQAFTVLGKPLIFAIVAQPSPSVWVEWRTLPTC